MALCLAHAADEAPDAFDAELERIRAEGTVDASGAIINPQLLERLLEAVPRQDDRPAFKAARFERATFQGEAGFARAIFEGAARFSGATFQGRTGFGAATFQSVADFGMVTFKGTAWFERATFQSPAAFAKATFEREARFAGATFERDTGFGGATFQGEAGFAGATFNRVAPEDVARFAGATFQGEARFEQVTFWGGAIFGGARDGATFDREAAFYEATFKGAAMFGTSTFKGAAQFGGATFQERTGFGAVTFKGPAGFKDVTFKSRVTFGGATFERARQVGPLLARRLTLDDAVFNARVQLEAIAETVSARRAQFPAGVHLRLRFASVNLDDANLAAPAILAGASSPFPSLASKEQVARGWPRLPPGPPEQGWRPRLLSVCRADVAGLRVADVDLCACRFVGAHNLDQLRLEGAPLFARPTGWWRARRKTLAEEQHWRANRAGRWRPGGWYPHACQPPASPKAEVPEVLEPARLAPLYRDLRKGREDAKDEPGAADFYYGECEMRRHDPGSPRAERLVLWAYWLLSGYALRAWRAVVALAVVVLVVGIMLAFWGFPSEASSFRPAGVGPDGALVFQQQAADPPGLERLPDAIRFSARSATALLRGPDRALTPLGEWLDIGLRFTGPLLLGLAVLSVRGRVRR